MYALHQSSPSFPYIHTGSMGQVSIDVRCGHLYRVAFHAIKDQGPRSE